MQPLGKRIFKSVESESETQVTQLPNGHDWTLLGLPETGTRPVRTLEALILGRDQKRRTACEREPHPASRPPNGCSALGKPSVCRRVRPERPEGAASAATTLVSQLQTHPQTLLEPGLQTSLAPCKTPKGAQEGGGYKARAETVNRQRPFGFLSASYSGQGHRPSVNLEKADPSHSKQQDPVAIFPPPPEPVLTRPRPLRHQHHPTVCPLSSSQKPSSRGGSPFPGLLRS